MPRFFSVVKMVNLVVAFHQVFAGGGGGLGLVVGVGNIKKK